MHELSGPISDRLRGRARMTRKGEYLGRESGKSSTRWFGGGDGTEAGKHGHGARAGDGRTSNEGILGKIKVIFRK